MSNKQTESQRIEFRGQIYTLPEGWWLAVQHGPHPDLYPNRGEVLAFKDEPVFVSSSGWRSAGDYEHLGSTQMNTGEGPGLSRVVEGGRVEAQPFPGYLHWSTWYKLDEALERGLTPEQRHLLQPQVKLICQQKLDELWQSCEGCGCILMLEEAQLLHRVGKPDVMLTHFELDSCGSLNFRAEDERIAPEEIGSVMDLLTLASAAKTSLENSQDLSLDV